MINNNHRNFNGEIFKKNIETNLKKQYKSNQLKIKIQKYSVFNFACQHLVNVKIRI